MCDGREEATGAGGGGGGQDAEPKTRTPHKDVGNNGTKWYKMVQRPRNAEASRVLSCSFHLTGKIPEAQLPGVWGKARTSAFNFAL